jgi:hypothetical protein
MASANYREVDVRGHSALLVTSQASPTAATDGSTRGRRWRSVLMWSEGGNVYALHGPGGGLEILDMAQTLQ